MFVVPTAHATRPGPDDRVILHGGADAGEAVAVSPAGATVRTAGAEYVIGWDRVAHVHGALAVEAEQYRDLATLAWRARTRLERGDAVSADPLYEELFDRLSETDGPTALSICEGLLRCRLWRGAHARALEAWLAWVRLAGEAGGPRALAPGASHDTRRRIWEMALLPVIDDQTGLVVSLPPIWMVGPSVRALVASDAELIDPGATGPGAARAHALAALYLHAARHEIGVRRPTPEIAPATASDPGFALVRDIVLARAGDERERDSARASLRTRLDHDLPAWQEAWCRVGLGRSLVGESDEAMVMEGVVELMHLPARFGSDQPFMTAVALAEGAAALERLGVADEAATLRQLLTRQYAGHPAMEWEVVQAGNAIAPPPPAAPTRSEPSAELPTLPANPHPQPQGVPPP